VHYRSHEREGSTKDIRGVNYAIRRVENPVR
jgi:hypothetical protein